MQEYVVSGGPVAMGVRGRRAQEQDRASCLWPSPAAPASPILVYVAS